MVPQAQAMQPLTQPPQPTPSPEPPAIDVPAKATASQGPVDKSGVVASMSSRITKMRSKKSAPEIEPKTIRFQEICLQKHPGRQWKDLTSHERVEIIREELKPKRMLINPRSTLMKYWDGCVALALVFVGLVTPYEVVYLSDDLVWVNGLGLALFVVNRIIDFLFLIDIVLQFFLKVEVHRPHRGGFITLRDPWTLRKRYLKTWFFIDVVSIFPYDILSIIIGSSSTYLQRAKILRCLKLMRLAKLLRMLRTSRILQRWQSSIALQFATQKIVKFLVVLALVSHWMACIWGLTGLTFAAELCLAGHPIDWDRLQVNDVSWVTALFTGKWTPDTPCSPFEIYTASLHWSVMTITSIGYGDISPQRVEEYLVGIVCMLLGGVLWAYIIGSLCSIISNSSPVERDFESNTDLLNIAMSEAHVPVNERSKYREYLREAKAFDRRVSFGEVADRFSPLLRKHLLFHVTQECLHEVYYFNDKDAPRSFTLDVASHLVPKFFSRGEPLDSLRHCLCLMDRGTVAHGGLILVPPSVFHEDFIITQSKYQKVIHTISLTYTQVLVLSRDSMEAILEPHPKFARKIRQCAAKMAFCRAVRMTIVAYNKWKKTHPTAEMSLTDAFDHACGDFALNGALKRNGQQQAEDDMEYKPVREGSIF